MEGEDFYGREREIRSANKLLDNHQSLLLSAPRRVGKSSFGKRLIEEKRKQGWKCIYIDVEATTTEADFLHLLIESFSKGGLWKQAVKGMTKGMESVLERVEKVSVGPVEFNFSDKGQQSDLYTQITGLIKYDEDTFIVVDELSLFLNTLKNSIDGPNRVAFILNWMRSLRQIGGTKVRWLFCGSIGLRNFTSMMNLSHTINDLINFHFGELDINEAAGLLKSLCDSESIKINEENTAYALAKLSWNIPYFIQILFFELSKNCGEEISRQNIDSAYEKICSEEYLGVWSERLKEYGEYEFPARQILSCLSAQTTGSDRSTLLNVLMTTRDISRIEHVDYNLSQILNMLENDGYIVRYESRRTFRSPLLRDYLFDRFMR